MKLKGKAAITFVVSTALAASMSVPAFALTPAEDGHIPSSTQSVGNYVKVAATRAAMPSAEILNAASVEESGQFIDTSNYFNWGQPKYMLAATTYSQNLSPYLANLATGTGTDDNPAAAFLGARTGGGNGPNAALGNEDTVVWNLEPDVVVGNNGGQADYSSHGAEGVNYGFSDYTGLAETMHSIAAAIDDSIADGDGTLRDGSSDADAAEDIAQQYEEYVFGTMGAVAQAVEDGSVEQRDVVLVSGAAWDDEAEDYVYTLMTTAASGGDGTASTNRYLETTANPGIDCLDGIAENWADANGSTVSAADLSAAVESGDIDLIMVGGQQGASGYADIMDGIEYDGLLPDTYFVEDNGSAGAMYGVVMNSVENAQNVGRILGMLYPEVVDQQSWMAYYYENFYHINEGDLATVMESALDGVRNANVENPANVDEAVEWDGFGGYSQDTSAANVQNVIDAGYAWYLANN